MSERGDDRVGASDIPEEVKEGASVNNARTSFPLGFSPESSPASLSHAESEGMGMPNITEVSASPALSLGRWHCVALACSACVGWLVANYDLRVLTKHSSALVVLPSRCYSYYINQSTTK